MMELAVQVLGRKRKRDVELRTKLALKFCGSSSSPVDLLAAPTYSVLG